MPATEIYGGIPLVGRFRFVGYCSDLAEMVSRNVGYDYHIRFVRDKQYGKKRDDGTWNGVIGELIKHVRCLFFQCRPIAANGRMDSNFMCYRHSHIHASRPTTTHLYKKRIRFSDSL